MSTQITPRAYETRLGNLTAKSVLALLADQCNDDGFGWPSVKRIAEKTEIQPRTVMRVIQVFEKIGVLARTTHLTRSGRVVPALQMHVERLGLDLRDEFADAYAVAQSKSKGSTKCLRDTAADVSETSQCVAETPEGVAETLPFETHNGGTVTDPPGNHTTPTPSQGEGENASADDASADDEFTDEQRRHLDKIAGDQSKWDYYAEAYRRENRLEREKLAKAAAQLHAQAEETGKLERAMPTPAAARAWVMRECSWIDDRRRRGLGQLVEDAVELAVGQGDAPWKTGSGMARAWKKYQACGEFLSVHYGPVKFVKLGIWRDERGWGWKMDEIKRQQEARVGSWN